MVNKTIIVILFTILLIVTCFSQIVVSSTSEKKIDKKLNTYNSIVGYVIGIIKDFYRYHSLTHLSCQAVKIYWSITWMPPYYPHNEEGWIDSGVIEIYRPVLGIVLRHFIFVPIDWIECNKIPHP